MPEIGEVIGYDPFSAAPAPSSGAGPQIGDVVDYDPFAPSRARAQRQNPDGSISTELSITVPDPRAPDRWINIPSMYGGVERSEDEALGIIADAGFADPETGRPIPSYDSLDAAVAAAEQRSRDLGSGLAAPQTNIWGEIAEVGRGIPAGAVQAAGTALRGIAANQPTQRYANYLDQIEHGVLYRTREREGRVPVTDDTAYTDILQRIADDPGMFQSQQLWLRHAIEGVRSGNLDALATARSKLPPEAVQERDLWRAGEAVSEFAEENFPAKPGYEDSLGRMVGEGLGSLGAGLAFGAIPGVGSGLATTFFTAMGSGEAADRAVAEGATDEQIIQAAGLGAGAGATDILPAEMLLGRIPGANVIANAVKRYGGKRTMQALGRISNQAIVESVQEGGQQTLQNLIAQEVYKPEQQILEGVVENAGIGGIVGGIAGLGREGVYQLSTRRSGSARGDRARAVREVPPPSPADEASPIPTADIIEGRERIADAEATETANKYLEVAGLPQIGQPVRVARGRDVIEGVVSDAWEGDDPGVTVRAVDGTETDLSLAQMQAMGATLTGLPMPAPRADIERKAQEIAQDAQKVREAAAQEAQRGAVESGRRREIDQIMADARRDADRRWERGEEAPAAAPEPERGALPQLSRAQVDEVTSLTRAGVPPGDAVRQVVSRAGVPPGETIQPDRSPGGVPPGDVLPGSAPTGAPPGDQFIPVTPTATGFGDQPPAETARRPFEPPPEPQTQAGVPPGEQVLREPMGPDRRPSVTGAAGRPEPDTGPPTRPEVVGPSGRPETDTGPTARPRVGERERWLQQAVAEATGRDFNEARGLAEAVAGATGQDIDAARGLAEDVFRATGRDMDRSRALAQAISEATGQDVNRARALAQSVAAATGRDVDARRALAQSIAEATGGDFNAARALAQDIARATGRDVNEQRALAEAVATATGRDFNEGRALAPDVAAATGRDVDQRRALAQSVADATGVDINQARAIAEDVSRLTGQDINARRALAQAVEEASGTEITQRRALAEAIARATGREITEARALAQAVSRATGRDMDARRALAQAIAESSGRDIPRERAEALAADDGRQTLTFEALRTLPTAREIGEAAEEAGLPSETATQVGEQVADALRPVGLPRGTTPTPEMVSREVQATGLPAEFGDRIAALVAERQGMADDARRRADQIGEGTEARAPRTIPERELPEATRPRDLPEDFQGGPEARIPRDLPADFGARIAEMPEIRDLPEGFAERIADRVAAIPDVQSIDTMDLAERVAELPEVRDIPPDVRNRMAARVAVEVRRLPEDFRGGTEARRPRDIPPRELPEARRPETVEIEDREARRPRDLPEDFGEGAEARAIPEDLAERVISIPEVRRLPESARERLRERVSEAVAERIEPPDVQLEDAAAFDERVRATLEERLRAIPEVRTLPPAARDRVAAEVRDIPADVVARMEARDAAPRPEVRDIPPRSPAGVPPGEAIAAAEAATETEPSEAQKEAGNYRKGKFTLHGMEISVETPKGAERSGVGKDGKSWAVQMPASYGYIRRTEGADGEQVDVYVGPEPESDQVFVVDQVDADTQAFDETKVILGTSSLGDAVAIYDAGFSDGRGPQRRGAITEASVDEFKSWLQTGDTRRPFSEAETGTPRTEQVAGIQGLAERRGPVPESEEPVLPQLRRTGDQGTPRVGGELSGFPERRGEAAILEADAGADRQRSGIRSRQRAVGDEERTGPQYAEEPLADVSGQDTDTDRVGGRDRASAVDAAIPTQAGEDVGGRSPDDTTAPRQETVESVESAALPPALSPEVERTEGEEGLRRGAPPPPIMRNDGQPFKTRQGAVLAARSKKLEDAEPVEVDGGWAIQPATPPAEPLARDAVPTPPAEAMEPEGQPVPEAEVKPPSTQDEPVQIDAGLYRFDPAKLTTDAKAFQYKSGGDDAGVTERLQGIKTWDPVKAGYVMVYERTDGTQVVADGHQRLGLAKRMMAEGQAPKLYGVLRREADGWTEAEVRAEAALKNIAEGSGDAFDAATVLRDAPPEALATLPPQSNLVRTAKDIARLEEAPFRAAKAAGLPANTVAVVGRVAEGDGPLQQALIEDFAGNPPPNVAQAEAMARMFREDRQANESIADLFGEQEVATSFYRERAKIIDQTIKRLRSDKRVFATLSRNAEQIQDAGNVLGADNEAIADAAGRSAFVVQQLATRTGPVSDAVKTAAAQVGNGELSYAKAVTSVVGAVQAWMDQGGAAGGLPGGGRAAVEGERQAAEEQDAQQEGDPDEVVVLEGQEAMFQRTPGPPLRATHSLSIPNLRSAVERGTLIGPSVAVTPAEVPHRSGGKRDVDVILRADAVAASPARAVPRPMSDVAAVVVPKVFPKMLRDQLEAQGIEVREKREDMTDEELAEVQSIPSALFKRAWHGSPHEFDRFSTAHMGAGEGAQAFGWGLYFAGQRQVAEWYRNNFQQGMSPQLDALTAEENEALPTWVKRVVIRVGESMPSRETRATQLDRQVTDTFRERVREAERKVAEKGHQYWIDEGNLPGLRAIVAALDKVKASDSYGHTQQRAPLYEVDLAPSEDEYLRWDRALSDQPEPVRTALENYAKGAEEGAGRPWDREGFGERLRERGIETGQDFYRSMERALGSDREASEALLRQGVRGIKYLDGSSRNRPFKEIKREFLAQLPDNAEIDEVSGMIGTGAFSPKYDEVLRRLEADDWLGFDYPAQAISAAYSGRLNQWDPSPELVAAVEATREDGTFNYVIFDDSDVAIEEIIYQRLRAKQDRGGGAGGAAQAAPPSRVRIRLNRRYDEDREGVRGDLERIGRETFGKQFRFELAESITAPEGGTVPGAFDPVNRVAYIALRADEAGMTGSLYHEGIHYLRNAGAFDKADGSPNAAWQTLERQAAQWRQDYGIDERYAGDVGAMDLEARERLLNEESIAEALADYATRGKETGFGPTVRMALNRILRFFRALRDGLRGRGFQTWESVFEADIGRGRAGARADAAQAPSRAELDRQLQTAWHASPHRFDQFSTAHIGSGEGAQVYGHGLYFADKRGVAEWYKENFERFAPAESLEFEGTSFDAKTQVDDAVAAVVIAAGGETDVAREVGRRVAASDRPIHRTHDVALMIGRQIQDMAEEARREHRERYRAASPEYTRIDNDLGRISQMAYAPGAAGNLERGAPFGSAEAWQDAGISPESIALAFDFPGENRRVDKISMRQRLLEARNEEAEKHPEIAQRWRDLQALEAPAMITAREGVEVTGSVKAPLYKVDLTPKDGDYLYWDRRLALQPKKVRNAMNAVWSRQHPGETMNREENGGEAYRMLEAELGSQQAASEALLAEGVRGIKYLDQSSRPMVGAMGRARVPLRETFNYVIFDDSDVAIQEIMLQRRRAGQGDLALDDDPRQMELAGTERLSEAGVSAARARDREQSEEMLVDVFGEDAVRRSDKMRSTKPQKGVEDLALFSGQGTLFQRGARRSLAKPPLDPAGEIAVTEATSRYRTLAPKTARVRARMDANRTLQGRSFVNDDTGWEIEVTRQGIRESLEGDHSAVRTEIVANLPELIRRAVRVEGHRDSHQRDGVATVHRFYAPLLLDDRLNRVKLTVREFTDGGKKHYDVEFVEIAGSDVYTAPRGAPAGQSPKQSLAPSGTAEPAVRMRPFLSGVKYQDGADLRWVETEAPGVARSAPDLERPEGQLRPSGATARVDDRPEGVKDVPDVTLPPRTLLQRGAKEDPKAFDAAASDWSGVDLTGSAEEVIKDKDRMGGFAESVKAGLKGTTAIQDPAVKVQEEKTHKDLNLAWRFLAPPLAWSKKYPAIHSLIRQGVDTEKDMSNRIQRLNRDWDRITKKLSKDEFAQLTGILFLGDAEAVTFTDEQLGRFNTTEKVRAAYKESRKFLDKIGRFTEQHERAMALPLLTRRTTLVRQMAGERGMDKAEFRELYNTRAELLGEQRRGGSDPRVLEFRIAEATEALYGGQEAPSELFLDRLKEADRLETRIADTKVRRREGYVPHKFFGRWRIFQAAQPNDEIEPYMGRGGTGFKDRKAAEKVAEASEGGILEGATPVQVDGKWGLEPKWKEVAGEHGLWKTRSDAVRAASHMAREGPDAAEIRVVPVEFEFPHDSATTLGDTAYFTFRSNVERLTGLSGEELNEVVTGAARRPFRRRIAGFLQYRTGMTGYSLDLDRVMRTHVGETVRYTSLDRLKFDAINTMEKEGLSAYRSSIQDRPVLAAAVQAWFRDVNGQKQTLEGQIDNVLNKSWVTPLRAGLAAGALGFLASGGPFNAPISPIVGAYIGYRVGRGLAQGGDFKTRAITGAMLGDMAHLKLGAFFNLMSALVNTSQVPLNTLPVLGVRDTTEGMIRYQKAVLSKLRGKPNADYRFLERMDINPLDTFAEGTRHKFKKESKLSKVSMVFFSTAEGFNRGVTALGAMNKAQRKGWNHKKVKDYANETLDRTQFHYGASDKPELLRNVLLRVPLQFKNFVAHQLSFVFGLKRKELPLFLLSMALVAGTLGIPGLDFVDTLSDWLFDVSPIAMMKEAALDAAVEGELEGGIATFLTRGVPGLAGVDMTGRVGMGDKFLPMQFRDWKGPWISTVENAVRHGREEAHWTHQMRNLSPGLGNPLVVLDAWENGGQVRSPWKRNRPEYVATETELIQKLAGARPIREARLQDLRDIERRNIERYRTDTRRYVDRIVAALDRGDRAAARAVMQEAMDAGIPISSGTIRRGIQDFGTQRALREFDRLPRTMKPEGFGRREAIERMAQ